MKEAIGRLGAAEAGNHWVVHRDSVLRDLANAISEWEPEDHDFVEGIERGSSQMDKASEAAVLLASQGLR